MSKKKKLTTKHLRPPKKHTRKTHAKVYWPYLPIMVMLFGSILVNIVRPLQQNQNAVLAYATEMSRSGLLSGTNSQRSSASVGAVTLNSKLNAAAQAKAQDMVDRDYWSHNTPEGNPPWVFIDAQGYAYQKAGENLAYGFSTSSATIQGWMNSASHKANMLDGTFTEVGFGFANSEDFVDSGNQTVVVAMYAKPVGGSTPAEPEPEPEPEPEVKPEASTPKEPDPEPEPEIITLQPQPEEAEEEPAEEELNETTEPEEPAVEDTKMPANSENDNLAEVEPQRISLIQQITNGSAPWSAMAASVGGIALAVIWITKHAVGIRRFAIEGEQFVAHHPVFDLIVVSIIAILIYLTQSSGVIL